MLRTRFVGTGSAVPDRVVSNDEIAASGIGTTDEWILARTGIRQRHVLVDGEATSDLAARAGAHAMQAAGIKAADVDCVVVATTTADMPMPSCAIVTARKLGIRAPAFDIAAACAGFTYGSTVVDGLIKSSAFKRILFVGAEALSKFLDWQDRGTCILFGDGAGALMAIAEETDLPASDPEARGMLSGHIDADPQFADDLHIPGGGTLHPACAETLEQGQHYLKMNGKVIFSQAVRKLSASSLTALGAIGLAADDVDLVVPHQANLRIIDAVARRMGIAKDKFVINLERFGNTSSASIPIALDECVRDGRVREGTTLLHCGLGAGLTWGAVVVRW